jgi:hypothetical protein
MSEQFWKKDYPYTLDKFLKPAILLCFENGDEENARKLLEVFMSYRKTGAEYPKLRKLSEI